MRVLLATLILSLAAILQSSSAFLIFGVKPNFVLASFVAAAFYAPDLLRYLLIIFLPTVLLKSGSGWQWEPVLLALFGMLAFYFAKRLPWNSLVNVLACVTAATILFYVFFDNLFLAGTWAVLALELFYNLIFSALIFYCLRLLFSNEYGQMLRRH